MLCVYCTVYVLSNSKIIVNYYEFNQPFTNIVIFYCSSHSYCYDYTVAVQLLLFQYNAVSLYYNIFNFIMPFSVVTSFSVASEH